MFLTRLAVLLATSLAACTKCFLATGLVVLLLACLQALHRTLVCLAITVAAASTYTPVNICYNYNGVKACNKSHTVPSVLYDLNYYTVGK